MLFILLLHLTTMSLAGPADRVVAIVEEELVLASEVPLGQAMTAHDAQAMPFWTRPRPVEVERLIDAAALRASAGEVSLYTPTDTEVRERTAAILGTFDDAQAADAFLAAWGLSDEGLRAHVLRRLTVERYLRRNLQSPPGTSAWDAELTALLDSLRATSRVRRIEPQRAR